MTRADKPTRPFPWKDELLKRAYHLALRATGDPQLAEDAVQNACARMVVQPPGSSGARPTVDYFMRAAYLNALTLRRSEQSRHVREEAFAMAGESVTALEPQHAAEQRELAAAARAALAGLPPEMRVAIGLCCEQGLTQREAAAILDVPEGTLARRVQRGLDELRSCLSAAGFVAAAPAALTGALAGAGLPPVPPGLLAALQTMSGGAAAPPARSPIRTARRGTKGGFAMKVVLGVLLAGALSTGAALLWPANTGGEPASPPAPAASGRPGGELWAFVNSAGRLDGPRREAMGNAGGAGVDDAGNLYSSGGRVIRVDGMVETVWGDNFNFSPLGLDEGPACWMKTQPARKVGWSSQGRISVQGLPLEGGDKGAIFLAASNPDLVYRIWKNKDKGGRWWFKRVAGGGSAAPPASGKSAPALEVKLAGPMLIRSYDQYVYLRAGDATHSNVYRYDDKKGELTGLLDAADYRDKLDKNRNGSPARAEHVIVGTDGTIYLGCSVGEGNRPVYKVSADRSKLEKIVYGRGYNFGNPGFDGPALRTTYFDGPILIEYNPPDTLFMTAVDDSYLRRYKDGRVSSLCGDGEWREFPSKKAVGQGSMLPMYGYRGKDSEAAIIGRGWVRHKDYVYMLYFNGLGSHAAMRFGPFDFNKPTVGPLVEEK